MGLRTCLRIERGPSRRRVSTFVADLLKFLRNRQRSSHARAYGFRRWPCRARAPGILALDWKLCGVGGLRRTERRAPGGPRPLHCEWVGWVLLWRRLRRLAPWPVTRR